MSRVVSRLVGLAQRARLVRGSLVQSVLDGARVMFNRHLLLTNITVAVGLSGIGDVLNQKYEAAGRSERLIDVWNRRRTMNQCSQGLMFGTLYHYWYIILDEKLPGRSARTILRKLAADQIIMVPVSVVLFLVLLDSLEGRTRRQTINDIKEKGPSLLAVEWTVGPLTQLFNFYFLPTKFRVVYDCGVALCFDCYYAHIKYRTQSSSDIEHKAGISLADDDVSLSTSAMKPADSSARNQCHNVEIARNVNIGEDEDDDDE